MKEFLKRNSLPLTAAVLFICSFQLMSLSVRNPAIPQLGSRVIISILAPLEDLHHRSVASLNNLWEHYLWLVRAQLERDDLKSRVKALEEQNSRLIELGSENDRLRRLLHFTESSGFHGITATVVGYDPSNWIKTITIDRGLDDGLRPGLAVVDGNALIGQTTAVSRGYAKVLLITDNASAVDALVQSSRARGIVEGGAGEKLSLALRYVAKDATVHAGDRVITAGLGGIFPKGIVVGVVESVHQGENGIFQTIDLLPSADFFRLENVTVILPNEAEQQDLLSVTMGDKTEPAKSGHGSEGQQ